LALEGSFVNWVSSLIPGIGPLLGAVSAAWSVLAAPFGRLLAIAVVAFVGGWQAKARLDEVATLRAVISKQRIDLTAARETADTASAVAAEVAQRDSRNQEIIDDLQARLAQRPSDPAARAAGDGCALDPAAVGGLRRLR
jgi:hypothetical protein